MTERNHQDSREAQSRHSSRKITCVSNSRQRTLDVRKYRSPASEPPGYCNDQSTAAGDLVLPLRIWVSRRRVDMVGKKSGRALLREEGLQRTDNGMDLTNWPQVSMINQKNYYTKTLDELRKGAKGLYALNTQYARSDFLKRDDQILALRLQQEERLDRQKKAAVDIDRARANGAIFTEPDADLDEDANMDDAGGENFGSKTIVIQVGSQNMRLGLATDALPKTVPMVIARRSKHSESEISEPLPKRLKLDPQAAPEEKWGDDFATEYDSMAADFRSSRRANKRRVLPNSRELVTKWNAVTAPEHISEHNDPLRIDWTEFEATQKAPDYIVGAPALRIPETSNPRYELFWPLKYGWLNEDRYQSRNMLMTDFFTIIHESIISQLDVKPEDWNQYSCVFVIPDLYEKLFVAEILHELIRDFSFQKVSFIQESLAATFGAGFGIACIVDIGAQKTSIACVEDGMIIEDSRINLKYGGFDVTETFVKMMLFDRFHYADFNLMRRHDFLLAEELKERFVQMSDENISVQIYDFHLRAHGQETRKYQFKLYDEGVLAALGYFRPSIFEHSNRFAGRRNLIPRSRDTYDDQPNDPISAAQLAVTEYASQNYPYANIASTAPKMKVTPMPVTPSKPRLLALPAHLNGDADNTPRSSVAGSPVPEDIGTPAEGATATANGTNANGDDTVPIETQQQRDADTLDRTIPLMPLHRAILTSIDTAARDDDRRRRDLLGSVMLIGGASKTPNLGAYLEFQLRTAMPQYPKEILVAPPPKELDPEILVWKGASVFGKLRMTNDSWIGGLEYDRLGARILNYKCMWHW